MLKKSTWFFFREKQGSNPFGGGLKISTSLSGGIPIQYMDRIQINKYMVEFIRKQANLVRVLQAEEAKQKK